jgi:hypothetical protein
LAIRVAVRNAYDRAFSAILDSNMTTIITSFFLIVFGTEEVKGFGITLIIGIFASLFTSLFVTKTVFGLLIDRFGVRRLGSLPLSIPRWDQMLRPNVRWTRLVLPFAAFSVLFVVAGTALFANYARQGQVLDIEFASGTAVTFEVTTRPRPRRSAGGSTTRRSGTGRRCRPRAWCGRDRRPDVGGDHAEPEQARRSATRSSGRWGRTSRPSCRARSPGSGRRSTRRRRPPAARPPRS